MCSAPAGPELLDSQAYGLSTQFFTVVRHQLQSQKLVPVLQNALILEKEA